ncbi:MAG: DUF2169 domain-containing protein, partial [Polyangiaceae bacterium]
MDITSNCPLRIGALFWQPFAGVWALTVACKATFRLVPGTAELVEPGDDPNEQDRPWDDDPSRGLRSVCDLVPLKPAAEVLLVGHAFPESRARTRALPARMSVGHVDKAIEVPAGFVPSDRWTTVPTAGLGPISPAWPERRALLGEHAASFGPGAWRRQPLPSGLDPSYFQTAPLDQRLSALTGDEVITLTHLHPKHAHLSSRLPGLLPRVTLERPGEGTRELDAVADTLWIDTDRGIATLVWRAEVPVAHPLEAGEITVAMVRPGGESLRSKGAPQRLRAKDLAREWGALAVEGEREDTVRIHAVAAPEPLPFRPPSVAPVAAIAPVAPATKTGEAGSGASIGERLATVRPVG